MPLDKEDLFLKSLRAVSHWPSLSHVTISEPVMWTSCWLGLSHVLEASVGLNSCELHGQRLEGWFPRKQRKDAEQDKMRNVHYYSSIFASSF